MLQTVSGRLMDQAGRAFFIAGPSKAGKTSFVRAGLIPVLKPKSLYLRCQENLEKWLPAEVVRRDPSSPASDLSTALRALAPPAGSRFYLVLDQFERVVRPYEQKPRGGQEFVAFLKHVMELTPDLMTIIYVVRSESGLFLSTLIELGVSQHCAMLKCEGAIIGEIIRKLAQQASIGFDPEIIHQLQDRCDNSDPKEPFTLAHVNAICNLMCDSGSLDSPTLQRTLADNLDTLNRLINQYDIIGFVEDIPFNEAARALLPRMMKVISKEGRQNLAECLSGHFKELFPTLAYGKERRRAA